jgi:hypothetical protein
VGGRLQNLSKSSILTLQKSKIFVSFDFGVQEMHSISFNLQKSHGFLVSSNALRLGHVKTKGFHGCKFLICKHWKSSISKGSENSMNFRKYCQKLRF